MKRDIHGFAELQSIHLFSYAYPFRFTLILAIVFLSTFAGILPALSQSILYSTNFGTANNVAVNTITGWTTSGAQAGNLNLSTASVSSTYTSPISFSAGANLADGVSGASIGTAVATLAGQVNTTGVTSIEVAFGYRASSSSYTATVTLEWSSDGTTWNNISLGTLTRDGSWRAINGTNWLTLPTGAENQSNLRFRFTFVRTTTGGNFRIDDFTVRGCPTPTITLGANPAVCQGAISANLSYSATTNSPNQYSIDYNAAAELQGFVDVTNATLPATPIVLTVPAAAVANTYNATLTVRNSTTGCVSTTNNIAVTVAAAPTVSITGPSSLCPGGITTLSPTSGGTWVSNSPSIATVTNAGVVTTLMAGSATFTFTSSTAPNCTATTGAVTVLSCNCYTSQADASAYNDGWQTGDNDGTGFGTWTLSTTSGNGSQNGHFIGDAATNGDNNGGGINTVGESWGLYANNSQTASAVRTLNFGVQPGGTITLKMDNGSLATGASVGFGLRNAIGNNLVEFYFVGGASNYTLDDASTTTTSIPYTDDGLTFSFTITSATTYNLVVTALSGSTYTFTNRTFKAAAGGSVPREIRLFNFNAGSGNPANAFFNSLGYCQACPNITTAANSNTPVCVNQTLNLTSTPSGGTSPYTFIWTGPNSFGSASEDPSIPTVSSLASGTYTITATDANGCTGTSSTTVVINPLPNAGTITGTTTICDGSNSQLASTSPITNGVWGSSNTSTATVNSSGLVTPEEPGTTIISYTVTDANNCVNTATVLFTVVEQPSTSFAGDDQTICNGGVVGLNADAPAVGTGTWSVVSGPSTSSSQFSNTGSPTAVFTPAGGGGTYTLAWTISNAPCTPSVDNVVITVNNCPCQTSQADATAYNDGWQSGDNDATGFGTWTLNTSSGNGSQNGHFIGSATNNGATCNSGGSINTSSKSWGMYANSGQTAEAFRPLVSELQPGGTLKISMDNGSIDGGGTVGIGVYNTGNTVLSEVFFVGGSSNYTLKDGTGTTTTTIPFTADGLIITYTPTSSTTYNVVISAIGGASQTFVGRTFGPGTGNIKNIRLFNANAGSNCNQNAFFNSLQFCAACPSIMASINGTTTICPSQSTNLTATISGGQSPYTVVYSNGITNSTVTSYTSGTNISVTPSSTSTYTLVSVTDANGCLASITGAGATVTVEDVTRPTLLNCPSNINLTTNDDGGADCSVMVTYTPPTSNDNCDGPGAATYVSGPVSGSMVSVTGSPYTVIYTKQDAAGNNVLTNCSFTITVTDNNNPTLICPGNQAINTSSNGTGDCTGTYTIADPVSDNCPTGLTWGYSAAGATTIAAVANIADGTGSGALNFNKGTTTVTLTGKDAANNVATTCSFDIVVTDDEAPTLACPTSPVNLNTGTGVCTAAYTIADPLTENCAGGTWNYSTSGATNLLSGTNIADGTGSGTLNFPVGTTTVSLTGTDAVPTAATPCTFDVVVMDMELPNAICKTATVVLDGTGNATLVAADVNNNSTDNCGVQGLSVSPNTFNCSNVTPVPTEPFISEYVEGSTASTRYIEIFNPSTSSINLSAYRLSFYNNGDDLMPDNATLSGTLAPGAALIFRPSGATNISGSILLSVGNFNGDDAIALEKIADNTRVDIFGRIGEDPGTAWTATGGYSTLDKTLRRKPTVFQGITTNPGSGFPTLTTEWDLFNADVVSGLGTHTINSLTTPVTLTVTDVNGKQNTCIANVTIADNIMPAVTCPSNTNINTSNNGTGNCSGAYTITDPVSDNCMTGLTWGYTVSGATTIAAVTGVADGSSSPALALTKGANTITLTGKDKAGNNATTCNFTVTVLDDELPALSCPATQNLTAGTNCTATYTIPDPLMDNCTGATWSYAATGATTITQTTRNDSQNSGSLTFNGGTTTIELNATDAANNAALSCTFNIVIADNQAPTALCKSLTVQLDANGSATIAAADVNNNSTDNCTIQSLSVSPNTVNCSNLQMTFGTDLIISEYVESGAEKYLEIYNPTASSINLSNYELRLYSNGSGSPSSSSATLSGTLAAGGVIFYRNSGSTDISGSISLSAINFNGDDAIVLYKTSTSQDIDIFGKYGNDPGTAWTGAGGYSTSSKTLRRKSSVIQGVTVNPSGTGPSAFTTLTTEWDLFADGTVSGLGSHTSLGTQVTLTVTDGANLSSTCVANVIVRDQIAPTLACTNQSVTTSSNGTGDCTGSFTINDPLTDNCTATWGYSATGATTIAAVTGRADGSNSSSLTLNIGTTNFVLTALDASGNVATNCTFAVTVSDNENPSVASCPSNTTLRTNDDGGADCAVTLNYTTPRFNDNCDGSNLLANSTTGPASGTSLNVGSYTVTHTYDDAATGNTPAECSFTVTVVDNTNPLVTACPGNITLKTSDDGGADCAVLLTYTAPTFADNCDGTGLAATSTSGPASGSSVNVGVHTVTHTYDDAATGNTPAVCTFTVTVQDDTKPTITLSGSNSIEICQNSSYTDAGATASDNCDGNITANIATNNPVNTTVPNTYTITYDVTDAASNMATQVTRTVVVLPAPAANVTGNSSLVCPGTSIALDGNPTGGSGIFTTHAWNQTGGTGSVSITNNNDGTASIQGVTAGTVILRYTVTDDKTCTGTALFTITVVNCNGITLVNNRKPTDPCSCNNDQTANGAQNGTFGETVSVTPTTNAETWTVVSINRLAGSGGLPTGIAVGNTLSYDAGGFHAISFKHVDDAGYTIIVEGPNTTVGTPGSPAGGNIQLTVSNICQYPVIAFDPTLPDNVCLNSTPITLTVSEANSFAGVASYTVNGNAATQFNPTAPLTPPGPYPVVANFTGTFVNNTSSNVAMPAFPGCQTSITDAIGIYPGPTVSCPGPIAINTNSDDVGDCDAQRLLNHPGIATSCNTTLNISFANGVPAPTALPTDGMVAPNGSNTYTFAKGQTIVTYTATDAANNVSSCMFTVTVTDNEPPAITCPTPAPVNVASGACDAVVNFTAPTGTDNCAGANTVRSSGLAPGSAYPIGTSTVVYTVTDGAGLQSNCQVTVTVNAPEITVTGNSNNIADGSTMPSLSNFSFMGLSLAGTPLTRTYTIQNNGTHTLNLTGSPIVDIVGGDAAFFTVSMQPGLTVLPPNGTTTFEITFNSPNSNTYNTTVVIANDDCDEAPFNFALRATTNCIPADITVCPSDIEVNTEPNVCSAVVNYNIASDGVPPPTYTYQFSGANMVASSPGTGTGSAFNLGETTVTVTATNDCNSDVCSFKVTVVDNQVPTISCPGPSTVIVPVGQCSAAISYNTPTTTDNCSSTVSLVNGFASGTILNVGLYNMVWQATDAAGNATTCSFFVTVRDEQAPALSCPSNINVPTEAGKCTAVVNYPSPVVTENCAGWSLSLAPGSLPSGSAFPKGANTVQWKVTDAGGLMSTCSFTVTVSDNQPLTITCPTNIVKSANANCQAQVFFALKGISDNCPGIMVSIQGTAPTTGLVSGSNFPLGATTVTYQATDGATLMTTCSFTVTVNDVTAPSISCPVNQTRNTDANVCTAVVNYAPVVTDNCPNPTWAAVNPAHASGSAFAKGVTTVVLRATDAAGLTKTCTFRVTVNDRQAPSISCDAGQSVNTGAGQCSAVVTYNDATFTDNCAPTSGTAVRISGLPSGAAFPKGVTNVVYRATDASGNFALCSVKITVTDNEKPKITCPNGPISRNTDAGKCGAAVSYSTPVSTDNCPGVQQQLLSGLASGSSFPVGSTVVRWQAKDAVGLTEACQFTVTVVDNQLPTITCPPNTTVMGGAAPCTIAKAQLPSATAQDNCGVTSLSSDAPASLPAGATVVTWTAQDAANQQAQCQHTVTVMCQTGPNAGGGGNILDLTTDGGLGLGLAPNPASESVLVTVAGIGGEGADLTIFDALGRQVWLKTLAEGTSQINVDLTTNKFADGLYQVTLRSTSSVMTKTLVIHRK